jgi:hypothetical protein
MLCVAHHKNPLLLMTTCPAGLFSEEQEAARAYDAALVRLKGMAAATNYSLACYQQQLAEHYQLKMVSTLMFQVYK